MGLPIAGGGLFAPVQRHGALSPSPANQIQPGDYMYHPNPSIDYCINRYLEELAEIVDTGPRVKALLHYPESRLPFPKPVLAHCLQESLRYAQSQAFPLLARQVVLAQWYLGCFEPQ